MVTRYSLPSEPSSFGKTLNTALPFASVIWDVSRGTIRPPKRSLVVRRMVTRALGTGLPFWSSMRAVTFTNGNLLSMTATPRPYLHRGRRCQAFSGISGPWLWSRPPGKVDNKCSCLADRSTRHIGRSWPWSLLLPQKPEYPRILQVCLPAIPLTSAAAAMRPSP